MKLNQAQRRLLTQLGSMVEDGLENHYYFLPLWFKIEKNSEVVDAYSFGHLPPELQQAINDQRENIISPRTTKGSYPLTTDECEKV